MSIDKIFDHWQKSYKNSWETAKILYKNKRYSDCLFYCHLSLEKLLKAIYVLKNKKHSPFIHDLLMLAQKSDVNLTKEQIKNLESITIFNIAGRYAEIKSQFYQSCNNKATADKYFKITENLIKCLKKFLIKK